MKASTRRGGKKTTGTSRLPSLSLSLSRSLGAALSLSTCLLAYLSKPRGQAVSLIKNASLHKGMDRPRLPGVSLFFFFFLRFIRFFFSFHLFIFPALLITHERGNQLSLASHRSLPSILFI